MTSTRRSSRAAGRPFRETGILPVDLVNTWDPYLADPERLPDAAALGAFLQEYGLEDDPREDDLEACRTLRAELRAIVAAPTPSRLIERLRTTAARLRAVPEIAESAGRWALTVRPVPGARPVDRLAVLAVAGLAEVVGRYGPERVGECRADPCRDAFVDASRNGGRRYCSKRCANRRNAAAFRRRRC